MGSGREVREAGERGPSRAVFETPGENATEEEGEVTGGEAEGADE
jgi:hypothetical protein